MNIDYDLMDRKKLREKVAKLNFDSLYQSIQEKIALERVKVVIHTPE